MATGAAVIRYDGVRGTTWHIRWRGADGRICKERVGSAAEGMTRRKARHLLEERLVDVRREGLRRLEPVSFAEAARAWLAAYPEARGLKPTTRSDYARIVERHLVPWFGEVRLAEIDVAAIERYLTTKRRAGSGAGTLNAHLNRLNAVFKFALKRGWARSNPVAQAERPRVNRREWCVLSPVEVRAVSRAFTELAEQAAGEERAWVVQARLVFLT
jgi:hypothetical protein